MLFKHVLIIGVPEFFPSVCLSQIVMFLLKLQPIFGCFQVVVRAENLPDHWQGGKLLSGHTLRVSIFRADQGGEFH